MKDILKQLLDAARINTGEGWKFIDNILAKSKIVNNHVILSWVFQKGLASENENVRDLAVSILEKSNIVLEEKIIKKLLDFTKTDSNPYVQFRSAFTLFNRNIRTDTVIHKLKEALADENVKNIAKRYLSEI